MKEKLEEIKTRIYKKYSPEEAKKIKKNKTEKKNKSCRNSNT